MKLSHGLKDIPPVVFVLALVRLLLQVVTAGRYGIFRDELYYLACADHLAWGYVDHPPLSIAVLRAWRAIAGDSVDAIRIVPAFLGAVLVVLAAVMARELGGGRFARILAALTVTVTPEFFGLTGFYSMNAFELLFWALATLVLIRIVKTDDPRLWLVFGAVAGLALLNKIGILFFCLGLAVAVPLTPLRRHLKSPHLWLGAVLALALFLPHILWQIANDWPTLEFIDNAKRYKIADISPLQFLTAQVMNLHPFHFPIWLLGLGFFLVADRGRFRVFGILYVSVFAVLVMQNSKPYYLAPIYPVLLAGGAIAIERFFEHRSAASGKTMWKLARPAVLIVLLLGGVLTAPFAVPILPVESLIAYQESLGIAPRNAENSSLGPLPQHFADRFGWREMATAVAAVYEALPAHEQKDVLIVTSNYGEAGAINYFGGEHGLPAAVSQHNNYFLWGPGEPSGNLVITVGINPDDAGLRATFESILPAGRVDSPYAMPFETLYPICVCRSLKIPLEDAWQQGKRYI